MNKIFKPFLTLALIACTFLPGEVCFAQPKEITPKEIVSYDGHTDAVKCVAFSPDGKLIASGAADNLLRVWEPRTGKNVFVGVSHKAPIWGVAFSPDGKLIATASDDLTVQIWDASNGKPLKVLKGHQRSVGDVNFSPDGKLLVSASNDYTIKVWNTTTWDEVRQMPEHRNCKL
jgi:WD40 repeat protein